MVRTPPFHGGNTGSNPVGDTIKMRQLSEQAKKQMVKQTNFRAKGQIKNQAKKYLGQNFLKNQNIINKIVQAILAESMLKKSISNPQVIYEIGPGNGALTNKLIKHSKVIAIEIDQDCINNLPIDDNLEIINMDALAYNFPTNSYIVGNLPYNIGTKIIIKLLDQKIYCGIFMLQKEVAERITGVDYSRLNILISARYDIQKIINVPATSFWPIPRVQSQVIKLVMHDKWQDVDLHKLDEITKIMFGQPRKKLTHLKKANAKLFDILLKMNIDLNLRPQDLNKEIYYNIARYVAISS